MAMSNIHAIVFALTPCVAETLERHANSTGNLACSGMANSVKYERNVLYFGVALTIMQH